MITNKPTHINRVVAVVEETLYVIMQ